ncbi:hypothetical protein JB92DRAFT_3093787, partial [Gautieria morchelliformis]
MHYALCPADDHPGDTRETHLLFSSVIPLDVDPPSSKIRWMAEVSSSLQRYATSHTPRTNACSPHVHGQRGTIKAAGVNTCEVAGWFLESPADWRRQDEGAALIDGEGWGRRGGRGQRVEDGREYGK